MPAMDVLLLALLVAVGSILGVRFDRTLLLVTRRWLVLAGDVVLFARPSTAPTSTAAARADLAGRDLPGGARRTRRPCAPAPSTTADGRSRVGWRLLALPLACNVASLVVLALGWGDSLPVVAAWLAIGCVAGRHRPHRRHLPRGPRLQRGPAAGPHRRADRPGQPPGAARERRAGARPRDRPPPRRPAAARPRRVQGDQRQPRPPRRRPAAAPGRAAAAARAAARSTCSPGSAATSSPSCCPGPASTRRRRAPSGCASWCCAVHGRGRPAARRGQHRRRHGAGPGRHRRRSCCAAPTSPCTPPSPPARACTSTSPIRRRQRRPAADHGGAARPLASGELVVLLQPQIT